MLPQQGILPPQRHPIILPLQGIASSQLRLPVCLSTCRLSVIFIAEEAALPQRSRGRP